MLKIDSTTTIFPEKSSRYFLKAVHQYYNQEEGQPNVLYKTEHKTHFQHLQLKQDLKRFVYVPAVKYALAPAMMAMMMIFWTKKMEHMFPLVVGAIALDTTVDPGVNSSSWSHTCTGTNLVIEAMAAGIGSGGSATYNSVNMPAITGGSGGSAGAYCSSFLLVAPATGAHTLAYSSGSGQRDGRGSISFSGADQVTGYGAVVENQGNSLSSFSDAIVTTKANSYVIELTGATTSTGSWSASNGQTRYVNQSTTNLGVACFYLQQASAGSHTQGATFSGSNNVCFHIMVEIMEAITGPANLKTVNGLAAASVKTIDGLALASVKTVNGLA